MSTLVAEDLNDFTNQYNTTLTPEDETAYQKWAKDNGKEKDVYDYDMRGFWKADQQFSDNGHGSDEHKKPNHPTFSDQSKYSTAELQGGTWGKEDGKDTFTPSAQNLKNMSADQLKTYFAKVEPDVILKLPESTAKTLYPNDN